MVIEQVNMINDRNMVIKQIKDLNKEYTSIGKEDAVECGNKREWDRGKNCPKFCCDILRTVSDYHEICKRYQYKILYV